MKIKNSGWSDTPQKLDYIVFIARMQPPHLAHIEIIKRSLELANKVLILVGSSIQPRTIKNPWTWGERDDMIRQALPDNIQENVIIVPIRDIMYNDQKWAQQVQQIVNSFATTESTIGIIGHIKDASSYYLNMFPQWKLIEVENMDDIHAKDIRKSLFTIKDDDFDLQVGRNLPSAIHDYLKAFMLTREFEELVQEYEFISKYKSAWNSAPYSPTFVTVDSVVVQSGHLLLVKRRERPGRGTWALPGGFVNQYETLEDAVLRELREETKIKVPLPVLRGSITKQKMYDDPNRSLRGRTITQAYLIELQPGELPKVKGSDDAEKANWIPLSTVSRMEDQMFEDHYHIINDLVGGL